VRIITPIEKQSYPPTRPHDASDNTAPRDTHSIESRS
jgi:hypothetical protein